MCEQHDVQVHLSLCCSHIRLVPNFHDLTQFCFRWCKNAPVPVHPYFGVVDVSTSCSSLNLKSILFHEHQHRTANVNNENEPRCNQTECTSSKRSHGKVFNHVKTPSKIRCNSKHSSSKNMWLCYFSGISNIGNPGYS